MSLVDVGSQHQTDIRNLFETPDPATDRPWKFAGLKPVVGEINPGGLFADSFFIMPDIFRRDIVFGRIVLIGPNAAPIESVVELVRRRRQNAGWSSVHVPYAR